jgi:hypothetical protein
VQSKSCRSVSERRRSAEGRKPRGKRLRKHRRALRKRRVLPRNAAAEWNRYV